MVELSDLIFTIRSAINDSKFTESFVLSSTKKLSSIGYQYDHATFPALEGTSFFKDESGDTPHNLAEALLWKLGKWKSYKTFCKHFTDDAAGPSSSNMVFYAYAKHLKDKKNPIYDQHAMRAIWAIFENLSHEEHLSCKNMLVMKDGTWKQTGSGKNTIKCYQIFVNRMNALETMGASKEAIDKLLMPLGKAIKKNTKNYKDLCILCGW